MEKREPSYILGENAVGTALVENSMEGPQKIKKKKALLYDLASLLLNKAIMQKDTCSSMFIAALFTIAKTQKQSECPQIHEWIKKMWYIYTMKYYSSTK